MALRPRPASRGAACARVSRLQKAISLAPSISLWAMSRSARRVAALLLSSNLPKRCIRFGISSKLLDRDEDIIDGVLEFAQVSDIEHA